MNTAPILLCLGLADAAGAAAAEQFARVIEGIKPSIVGVASFQKTREPALAFIGTGFVVGDGLTVLTAAHVIPKSLDSDNKEVLGVLVGHGDTAEFRPGSVSVVDHEHDLARLSINGSALPALRLGDSATVQEGQAMAFTGFPLGMVLGLHHVTHRATVSAITPLTMPSLNAQKLDARLLVPLQKTMYSIFQLDGTAYPGSSGSPLYDPETGLVYGVINMVYIKGMKESAISTPSGISYAIPGNFIRQLGGMK